jgi:multimeric flavodoxin WrbA
MDSDVKMKVLAINGSARKHWNTATLLNKALEGAASKGAQTERVHLYDLNFKGCISCYECKLKNGPSFGKCAYKDELSPLLSKIEAVDALILGAPIYLGTIPGVMKSFLERLATYITSNADGDYISLFPRKIPTAFIHTLGGSEEYAKATSVMNHIRNNEMILKMIFGSVESLVVADTLHVDDYSKYVTPFDAEAKMKRHKEVFPLECKKAFKMGARLAQQILAEPKGSWQEATPHGC